jgi:serine/threonine protein kinase
MLKLDKQERMQDRMQERMQDGYYKIAFYLIKSLLHALAKIHDTGIAHQNITQNSILVSTFDKPGEIKVKFTDFGLGCGCPKDSFGNYQPNIYSVNNRMIPWQQYENIDKIGKKIGSCKENGHVPVKYINKVLKQLQESDYLKISQKFDSLCIGLIIIKILLHFDTEISAIIDNLFSSNMNMNMNMTKLQILRNTIWAKYFSNDNNDDDKDDKDDKDNKDDNDYKNKDNKDDAQKPLMDMLSISNANRKLILKYLKIILKYMICSTIKRISVQYVMDKIIIYEKYKNDIF